jgi:hypothetical protein
MARPMSVTARKKPITIVLGPLAARALGSFAVVAMHAWFIIKLTLPSQSGMPELAAGVLALSGLIASAAFFVCTYGVLANAPDDMLDEWQVLERNRAYFDAFRYLVAMLLVGGIGSELCARVLDFELTVGVMQNYLLLMFATAMVLPAGLLAWRDNAPSHG